MSLRRQMPKHKTRNILLNNLRNKDGLVTEFGQFLLILQREMFYLKIP